MADYRIFTLDLIEPGWQNRLRASAEPSALLSTCFSKMVTGSPKVITETMGAYRSAYSSSRCPPSLVRLLDDDRPGLVFDAKGVDPPFRVAEGSEFSATTRSRRRDG
ncbi:MAG: hypothetical protein M3P85_13495 [Actinomycetota bacterium]|nr:hypothetical protein [Actinomycetota bacterium]